HCASPLPASERTASVTSTARRGFMSKLSGRFTYEISGVVDAARALVSGDLRIGAQGTRAVHLAVGTVRRDQLLRRFALLHPLLERAYFVEHIGTFATVAVAHSRLEERPDTVGRAGCA